ncbi:hypothetical protein [Hymenobacter sp. AT01-02]|uniref:hypothetical protein n=1 Tax=Hymenobacter sp. AT01-02 TaxID=1571877 RepID=UPI00128F8C1B|nr:hypothetical protein [Hymenobacter sp. AT01-02]
MIHNCSCTCRLLRFLMPAVLAAFLSPVARAQTTPDTTLQAPPSYRNAVRLDLGGVLARNVAYNALTSQPRVLLPVLVGYERQLGQRTSANAEVLVHGGTPDERTSGLALQGRYYYYQRHQRGLAGLYAAPTISYRYVRQQFYYTPVETHKLAGAGVLLGAQVPLGVRRRLLLDVSGGIMTWVRVNPVHTSTAPGGYYQEKTYYERNSSVFDGRISLGYRF